MNVKTTSKNKEKSKSLKNSMQKKQEQETKNKVVKSSTKISIGERLNADFENLTMCGQ
jgi:hypothetical protein